METSVADEVEQVTVARPHVVLLGAGASRAAFPAGERNGRRLPLMVDFLDIVPLPEAISSIEGSDRRNFEEIYSELATDDGNSKLLRSLEEAIFDYFAGLQLPDQATLYDHLILSLRPKDVIATFNWDPFLIQAAIRNGRVGGCPRLLFLHGNVLQGYCQRDRVHGVRGARCSRCGDPFFSVGLLYPIREKNYDDHPAIDSAWKAVRSAFRSAFMVTIFGYGAPQSDRGVIELLHEAWGNWQSRSMEQFEIIDTREESGLVESWRTFIHTHHYEIHDNFYDSWIANHPRRTGEAYWNQYLDAKFIENNPVPRPETLSELWAWYQPLLEAERQAEEQSR